MSSEQLHVPRVLILKKDTSHVDVARVETGRRKEKQQIKGSLDTKRGSELHNGDPYLSVCSHV
jgi:hypothetical protein